jgi:hypothetical protein
MAIALAGLLRSVSIHLWKERSLRGVPTTRIDARYAGLHALLPLAARLGYLSDEPRGSERSGHLYFDALYALAPRVLLLDPPAQTRFWVANVSQPASIDALCQQRGLREVARFGPTALLRSK